jgi:hypothetical protein
MIYDPEKALDRNSCMSVHPVYTSETYSNDCLIKAINFFLRWYYFTHQMQVLRLSAKHLKVNQEYVKALKIAGGGVKINTFFDEFLIKGNKAYRLYQVKLDVDGGKQTYFKGNISKFLRDFVKGTMLPVFGFKYHEILVTTTAENNKEIYTHAGAFIRREIAAKNKYKKKAEIYYYDSNQNDIFSLGGQSIASKPMEWEIFKEYQILKVYALAARTLPCDTEEERGRIVLEHLRIGRNFIEKPEEAIWEHYVHLTKKEGQKVAAQALVEQGNKYSHGNSHLSMAQRTAKKNPKRAASA